MIAGFPGETDADFEELCQFVEAAQFDRLGVFSYSDEETSASFHLDGKVDGRTIYNRRRRLMAIQRRISRARNRGLIGREVQVLVEGPSPETDLLWQARMATQAPEIDGVCLVNDVQGRAPRVGDIRRSARHRGARLRCGRDVARAGPKPLRGAMRCPICKKEVEPGGPDVPFCSDRCRIVRPGQLGHGEVRDPGARRTGAGGGR